MHHPSPLSPDNILRFLQVTAGGASLEAIQRGLRLRKSDHRPLARMLVKLKKRKAVEELPGGRFILAGRRGKARDEGPERSERGRERGERHLGAENRGRISGPGQNRNSLSGRLILHQDGYGFVVPD